VQDTFGQVGGIDPMSDSSDLANGYCFCSGPFNNLLAVIVAVYD